jgi:hypothetical protein
MSVFGLVVFDPCHFPFKAEDADGSLLQTEYDDTCSNKKNSKPLLSCWSFSQEQNCKESYE